MANQPLSPDLEELQANKRVADDLSRRKKEHLAEQLGSEEPLTTEARVGKAVDAINIPEEQAVADRVNDIPVDGEEDEEHEENDENTGDQQQDEDQRRQEDSRRQLEEYQRQRAKAEAEQRNAEAQAKQQQQPQTQQNAKTNNQTGQQQQSNAGVEPKQETYKDQGGDAIQPRSARSPRGFGGGEETARNAAASGEKATGAAGRATSAVGRGAARTGEAGAKAAAKAAKLAAQTAKLAAKAAAWVGRGLIALASTPYGWIVIVIIFIIILLGISAIGIYGASVGSPNSAGKSMTDYPPVYEVKGLLADIATKSNIGDIATTMQKNKDKLSAEIQKIKTDLEDPRFTASPDKVKALGLLTELERILNSVSTTDPTQNQKLAEEFLKKDKELIAIWSVSEETLPGTTSPIKTTITSYGAGTHDCTIWDKSKCDDPGHRAVFGIREFEAKVPITADAVDLGAPIGTQIYAPFAGKYEYKGGFYVEMEGASSNGVALEAELLHCKLNAGLSESGTVSIGQEICKLDKLKTDNGHLHFELKVNGKDVSRLTKDESESQLWKRMKKILSGQP